MSLPGTALPVAAPAATASTAAPRLVPPWYSRLRKPPYQPPGAAFPAVWTILYGDIAATSAVAIDGFRRAGRHDKARRYATALSVNLLLNAGWSWLFFRYHKLGVSALGAAALTASSAGLGPRTSQGKTQAGPALSPFLLWGG